MLADVVVGLCFGKSVALVAGVGQMFLVLGPSDFLGVEQICDCRDVGWNFNEFVVVHPKVIATGRGTVIGLGGVRDSPVIAQGETLLGQLRKMRVFGSFFIVLSHSRFVSLDAQGRTGHTIPGILTVFSSQIFTNRLNASPSTLDTGE